MSTDVRSKIQVKSLDHVTLVVADLERSRAFYCDLLGMREEPRPAFSFAGSWFQAGPTQIHLILEHDRSGPAGRKGDATTRQHHFAFLVEDSAACAEELKSRGIPILSGPQRRPDGATQTFLLDPDGHIVELCSPAKS